MEKLICDCGNSDNHYQYVDPRSESGDTIVECMTCHRFLKFTEPQQDVPTATVETKEPDA